MNFIKQFNQISKSDNSIAGGKGASLGEMTRAEIPVPPGFVVLSSAFEKFLEETDLNVEIDSILHSVNIKEMHTIESASEKIKDLILKAKMPKDIGEEIKKEFKKLNTEFVAVRSSATAEDSSSAAWAGQLDSFLNTTEKTLLANVQRCWASLFTPRAIFYRFEKDLHDSKISVAVVVQKMIESEVSGIAFSVHPVTQDHNQMIIEAGYGLGEAIVSGQITPDSYVIEKNPRRIIDKNVSVQERGIYRKPEGGNEWQTIPKEKSERQKLTDEQILELSELIIKIENHYGAPQDIEWAMEDGKFYIVQSRPITTLLKKRSESSINDSLTKEILNTRWSHLGKWIEPALATEVWLDYGTIAQQFFTQRLDKKILCLDGDYFLSHHDSSIFQAAGYEASKNHNKKFFQKIYHTVQAVAEEISDKVKNIVSVTSFLEDYKKLTGVWMPLNNIATGIEKYVQEVDPKAFMMMKGFLDEKPWTLQQIDEMNELKVKIETAIGKKLEKSEEIPAEYSNEIKKHINKYKWIGTNNFILGQLTIDNLIQRMQQSKINARKDFAEKHDTKLSYLIWLLDLIGYVRFKAAETSGYTTYYFKDHLISLAKEKGLTYEDIVEHTINEISSKNITKETAKKRKNSTGFYFNGKEHILSMEQIEICKDKLLSIETLSSSELRGLSAQHGNVRGIVKIVINQNQMNGFENGMVLVAHETTPDIIFAMQKSSAIITDFGGLTSHAAIIARELKKPCIVGTGFATKVLHDGDLVEVDADKGVVRILEKAK